MPSLRFSSEKVKSQRFMDQFLAYGEHRGLMMGGSWDHRTGAVDFYPYAHREKDCSCGGKRTPYIPSVTAKIKAEVLAWLRSRGVRNARWGR